MSSTKGPDWDALRRAYRNPPVGLGVSGEGQGYPAQPCPPSAASTKALGEAETDTDLVRDLAEERAAIMIESGVPLAQVRRFLKERYGCDLP